MESDAGEHFVRNWRIHGIFRYWFVPSMSGAPVVQAIHETLPALRLNA
jgi:hypothetical protein